jgi:hypothetical protein
MLSSEMKHGAVWWKFSGGFEGKCSLHLLLRRWKLQNPPKRRQISIILHVVTSKNSVLQGSDRANLNKQHITKNILFP